MMRAAIILGVVFVIIAVVQFRRTTHLPNGTFKNLKQTALAVQLYAGDHDGFLPASLNELVPAYTTADYLRGGPTLLTPGVNLRELPNDTVILRALETDGSAIEIRADMSSSITLHQALAHY